MAGVPRGRPRPWPERRSFPVDRPPTAPPKSFSRSVGLSGAASSVWQLPFCIDTLTLSTQGGKPILCPQIAGSLYSFTPFYLSVFEQGQGGLPNFADFIHQCPRDPHEAADAGQGTRMPRSQQWAGAADGAAEVFLGAAECKNAARPSVRPSVGCCRRADDRSSFRTRTMWCSVRPLPRLTIWGPCTYDELEGKWRAGSKYST